MDLVKEFKRVRDILYRIPLSSEEKDDCCTGKARMLIEVFKKGGYDARYRICTFKWSDLELPQEIEAIPHDNDSSHMFAEVKINDEWKITDPTWDIGLSKIFKVNDWDGKSDTEIAVPAASILSPEESIKYMEHISTPDAIAKDYELNREFYRAINQWLEKERRGSV